MVGEGTVKDKNKGSSRKVLENIAFFAEVLQLVIKPNTFRAIAFFRGI